MGKPGGLRRRAPASGSNVGRSCHRCPYRHHSRSASRAVAWKSVIGMNPIAVAVNPGITGASFREFSHEHLHCHFSQCSGTGPSAVEAGAMPCRAWKPDSCFVLNPGRHSLPAASASAAGKEKAGGPVLCRMVRVSGACLFAVAGKDDGSAVRPRICALESTNPST